LQEGEKKGGKGLYMGYGRVGGKKRSMRGMRRKGVRGGEQQNFGPEWGRAGEM